MSNSWQKGLLEALERGDGLCIVRMLRERAKPTGALATPVKVEIVRQFQRRFPAVEERYRLVRWLIESECAAARDLGALMAATFTGPLWLDDPEEACRIMLGVADDPHWEVREVAPAVVFPALEVDFEGAFRLLQSWTVHPAENVRRAAALVAMRAARERRPEWGPRLLDLIEPLLSDRSEYVRRNLGAFAIGDGFLRCYPQLTLERLASWAEREDEQVRWNVAMAFSSAEAARYVEAAVSILGRLAEDERRYVWRAVASALRNLGRRVPEQALPVLSTWLQDDRRARPAAVAFRLLGRATEAEFIRSSRASPGRSLRSPAGPA
ncbi:hypothetical protein HRbin26_01479 [bacterium HR26]|nr:hypothetical protein HRbin26_01479 [bacterium HR26]